MTDPQLDVPPSCPRCGEGVRIARTVPSERGFYCVCQQCWYSWHCDPSSEDDSGDEPMRLPS